LDGTLYAHPPTLNCEEPFYRDTLGLQLLNDVAKGGFSANCGDPIRELIGFVTV
jgi:hypothetical protein